MSDTRLDVLEERIGYSFKDRSLLEEALTHASAEVSSGRNYERLEFLGDAFINLVIADYFFSIYPDYSEGRLTHLKSNVVNRRSLARLGRELGLDDFLFLGKSFDHQPVPPSILGDAVEALCAAVFLDAGVRFGREFVLNLFKGEIERASRSQKDAKSRLQEIIQKHSAEVPVYEIVYTSGKEHEPRFAATVRVCGILFGPCEGYNKKQAEQNAAVLALKAFVD